MAIQKYLDCADTEMLTSISHQVNVDGITTNPTTLRNAGVSDYLGFARRVVGLFPQIPVSLEVIQDEPKQILREAQILAGLGTNVFVKVPVVDRNGGSLTSTIRKLAVHGTRVNVTAVMTSAQVESIAAVLDPDTPSIVSLFAGRIADTGVDPEPICQAAASILSDVQSSSLLWASPREILNVAHAERSGAHIITLTPELFSKYESLKGKDLEVYSAETSAQFHTDARMSGLTL